MYILHNIRFATLINVVPLIFAALFLASCASSPPGEPTSSGQAQKPGPGPEAPAPEAPTPEAPAPEASAPEAPAPEASAPEAPAPDAPTPEAPAPEAPAPEAPAPEAPAPEAPAPEAPAPEAPTPEAPAPIETVLDGKPSSSEPVSGEVEKVTPQDVFVRQNIAKDQQALVITLCEEIGSKLGSVSIDDCLRQQLIHSDFTTQGRSLAYREYPPVADRDALGKVLVIGGIHGDEFSSVSVLFKWMNILNKHHSGLFHWRFVPTMNPDGLLRKESQRQNHNGVDLNRNFPTTDWEENALAHWRTETHNNPRRHPGLASASEPEVKWLVQQISTFKPDVIISMHAPFHLVDYDGPPTAPNKLGSLYLRDLGVFPGSLGNYAGIDLNVPIVTVELKSAGIMPPEKEIDTMWSDLVRWLQDQLSADISDYKAREDVSELSVGQ